MAQATGQIWPVGHQYFQLLLYYSRCTISVFQRLVHTVPLLNKNKIVARAVLCPPLPPQKII